MTVEQNPGTSLGHEFGQRLSWRDWIVSLPSFLNWWIHSRNYLQLWGGVPALVVGLLVMLGILSKPFYSMQAKADHYRLAAHVARDADEFRQAELWFLKLHELEAMDAQTAYDMVLLLEADGRTREAVEKIKDLAPDNDRGYGPAHLWMAKAILNGQRELSAEAVDRMAQWHLERAIEHDPRDLEARRVLALHYFRLRRFDDSAAVFKTIAAVDPESGLPLAQAYIQSNRPVDAQREARKLVQLYERWEKEGRALTVMQFLRWTEAHAMLGELQQAERVLYEARAKFPHERLIQTALASVYLRQADVVQGTEHERLAQKLVLLDRALKADPGHTGVLGRLAELTRFKNVRAETARTMLKPILADAKAPALVHVILGANAAESGDYETAELHFEQAYRLESASAVSMNNLAWVLAMSEEPDLERALQLVDQAVRLEPSRPDFRETRGQVLLKLKRWREAISDFEFALQHMKNLRAIHTALAAAYSHLGDTQLAKLHREKAASATE